MFRSTPVGDGVGRIAAGTGIGRLEHTATEECIGASVGTGRHGMRVDVQRSVIGQIVDRVSAAKCMRPPAMPLGLKYAFASASPPANPVAYAVMSMTPVASLVDRVRRKPAIGREGPLADGERVQPPRAARADCAVATGIAVRTDGDRAGIADDIRGIAGAVRRGVLRNRENNSSRKRPPPSVATAWAAASMLIEPVAELVSAFVALPSTLA